MDIASLITRIKTVWKTHKRAVSISAVILILLVAYLAFRDDDDLPYEFIVAERGELIQDVSVTGKLEPLDHIDLAFEQGGTIAGVHVSVGDEVAKDATLIELDHRDVDAQLAQANADVTTERERLNELLRGTRIEEIEVQEADVKTSELALRGSRTSLFNALQDAYTQSDDAIRNRGDQFFTTPESAPKLTLPLQGHGDLEPQRRAIADMLFSWKLALNELTIESDLVSFSYDTTAHINVIKIFLDELSELVNRGDVGTTATEKSLIFTARSNVDAARTAVTDSRDTFEGATATLEREESELALQLAGSASEELAAQRARLLSAQARVREFLVASDRKHIRAPFAGRVAKQEATVGAFVSAGEKLVSVLSPDIFEIRVNIPETDIANVFVGDEASFTLDAFRDDLVFSAVATSIDSVETLIEGVSTYKVVLSFSDGGSGVRSGMTADVRIHTDRRDDVIAVPARAVITQGNLKFVRIAKRDGSIEERTVETGLRGSDGRIEIISGVEEGERVIIFIPEQ